MLIDTLGFACHHLLLYYHSKLIAVYVLVCTYICYPFTSLYVPVHTPVPPPPSTAVPVVEVTATPQARIALGQSVSLFCNVTRANPNIFTYVWRLNGGSALSETTNTLNLTNVMANQFGTYSCDVTNTAGTGSGSIVIEEGGKCSSVICRTLQSTISISRRQLLLQCY